MKAHIHKVDLTDVKELYEVRIFENDSDVKDCMKLETPYQGCKLIRVYDDNQAWLSLMHGLYGWAIVKQLKEFLFETVNVDLIQWSGNGSIRKIERRNT